MRYKLSKYNVWLDEHSENGDKLCYNSRASGFALFSSEECRFLDNIANDRVDIQNLREQDKNMLNNFITGAYLIPEDINELDLLKYNFNNVNYSKNSLSLTILPTLDCNCACPYCFENKNRTRMSDETQNNLIEYIKNYVRSYGPKNLNITWFGGEPLLEINRIESLSNQIQKIVEEHSLNYSASMISNCILLTPDVAKKLKELRISNIQVTLDGPKFIHDTRRVLKGGQPTFDRICKNVLDSAEHLSFAVRINIDKIVFEYFDALMNDIDSLRHNNIGFYPGMLDSDATVACSSIESSCMSIVEFSKFISIFFTEITNRNHKMNWYHTYKPSICCAVSPSAVVICPDGSLCRCWNQVGVSEEAYGNINDSNTINGNNYFKWVLYDPFKDRECLECIYFPLCLGGCPAKILPPSSGFLKSKGVKRCTSAKYNINEILKLTYRECLKYNSVNYNDGVTSRR